MRQEDFQPGFPGSLVPVTFREARAGVLREHAGLAFVPAALPPPLTRVEFTGRLFDALDGAKTALLQLDALIDTLPGRTALLSAMRVREAHASSKIEDTFAPLQEVALAGLDDQQADVPASEVWRNRMAIEHGLASALPISVRLLKEMHAVLIVKLQHRPGELRDIQVCIGDHRRGIAHARFVPPPATMLADLLGQWELFCNPKTLGAPARVQLPYYAELALAHYQFEAIHPFSDGNGRLGRAIVSLAPVKDRQLRHPVCNLSEWIHENRQEYYDRLLRVSTHGEWEEWTRFFCLALEQQAQTDMHRARRLASLYTQYDQLLRERKQTHAPFKLLDHLFDRQVVTVHEAQRVMEVGYEAARKQLKSFEELGMLEKARKQPPGPRVDVRYIAMGVIQAIMADDHVSS
jgi:Fic family protein